MPLLQAFALAHGVRARPIGPDDFDFLRALYASVREREVASTGWPPAQQHAFLSQQFESQHRHYQSHFAGGEFLLLQLHSGQPIGRLYWHEGAAGATLVDISLVPEWRGCGWGTALMRLVTGYADAQGQSIGLHVEPGNPALALYRQFGFEVIGGDAMYLRMRRAATTSTTADTPAHMGSA